MAANVPHWGSKREAVNIGRNFLKTVEVKFPTLFLR